MLQPSSTRSRCSINDSRIATAGKFSQGASSPVGVSRLASVSYCSARLSRLLDYQAHACTCNSRRRLLAARSCDARFCLPKGITLEHCAA